MGIRWHAFKELLERYTQVFRAAWRIRHELTAPQREEHELAFLPAHLELTESPVHPAPKWAARLIMLFVVLTVLWAAFGKINVVTTAQGKLVPRGQIKVVQPMDTGIVHSILVHDGQWVHAGQPLIVLDPIQADADVGIAQADIQSAALTIARTSALLVAQKRHQPPTVSRIPAVSAIDQSENQSLADAQYADLTEKLASARAELLRRRNELASTLNTIAKLEKTAPLAAQVARSYAELVKGNYVSHQDYLQKEQNSINISGELAAERSQARALQASITQQKQNISATAEQFRSDQLDQLNKAQAQKVQAQENLAKAKQRAARLVLRAPVTGTVQQLDVFTVGGVVTQAKSLMEIVPDNTLEVEAQVSNKDIGFISDGQKASIKLVTFPFTQYGYLHGKVRLVPNDAETTKQGGLIFPVRISLDANRMWVDGHWVKLVPGMAVSVDIKTGRHSVANYFLSPLLKTAEDSLHER